jgi:hypothetical protein
MCCRWAPAATHDFDETPNTFDTAYFANLKTFYDSSMLSLCPQARRPREAHWFGPKPGGGFIAMLDTDVSMTVMAHGSHSAHTLIYNRARFSL